MGWTFTHKNKGGTLTEFFIKKGVLKWTPPSAHTYRVLDSATVKLREYYAAIERITNATGERCVFCVVIKCEYRNGDHYNFGYKDMEETCGPGIDNCPERILDLLTPTEHQYATEWRQRCRDKINARKERPKIVVGAVLKRYMRTFEVIQCLGRRGFLVVDKDSGCGYLMSHFASRSSAIELAESPLLERLQQMDLFDQLVSNTQYPSGSMAIDGTVQV